MKRKLLGLKIDFIISYLQTWDGAIIYRSVNSRFRMLRAYMDVKFKIPVSLEIKNNKNALMTTISGQHWVKTDRHCLYNIIAFNGNIKKVFSSDNNYRECAIQAGNAWDKIELVIQLEQDMGYREL